MEMQQLAQGGDEAGDPSPRQRVSTGSLNGPLPMPTDGKFEARCTHCTPAAPVAPATHPPRPPHAHAAAALLSCRSQRMRTARCALRARFHRVPSRTVFHLRALPFSSCRLFFRRMATLAAR